MQSAADALECSLPGEAEAALDAAPSAAPAAAEADDQIEWQFHGHDFLGQRIARCFGKRVSLATITKWAPEDVSEGDPALFHASHDDGDEEGLEEYEVTEALERYKVDPTAAKYEAKAVERAAKAKEKEAKAAEKAAKAKEKTEKAAEREAERAAKAAVREEKAQAKAAKDAQRATAEAAVPKAATPSAKLAEPQPGAPPLPKPPRAAKSALQLYAAATRAEATAAHPELDGPALTKLLQAQWKALDEEARAPFVAEADADAERHAAERATYEAACAEAGVDPDPKKRAAAGSAPTPTPTPGSRPGGSSTTPSTAETLSGPEARVAALSQWLQEHGGAADLVAGWTAIENARKDGAQAGTSAKSPGLIVYFVKPDGTRFRSRKEVSGRLPRLSPAKRSRSKRDDSAAATAPRRQRRDA